MTTYTTYDHASWMWERNDGGFSPFSPEVSYLIESAYMKGASQFTSLTSVIDFQTMTQHGGGVTRAVERVGVDLNGVPELNAYWTWALSPDKFVAYDMEASVDMEIAYLGNYSSLDLSKCYSGLLYTIDFVNMKQTSQVFTTERAIKRVPLPQGISLQALLQIPMLATGATSATVQAATHSSVTITAPSAASTSKAPFTTTAASHPLQTSTKVSSATTTATHPLLTSTKVPSVTKAASHPLQASAKVPSTTTAASHPLQASTKVPSATKAASHPLRASTKVPSATTAASHPLQASTKVPSATKAASHPLQASTKVPSATTAASHPLQASTKVPSATTAASHPLQASTKVPSATKAASHPLQASTKVPSTTTAAFKASSTVTATSQQATTTSRFVSNPLKASTSTRAAPSTNHTTTSKHRQPSTQQSTRSHTVSVKSHTASKASVPQSRTTTLASHGKVTQCSAQASPIEAASQDDDPILASYDLADDILSSYSSHLEVPQAASASSLTRRQKFSAFLSKTVRGAFSKYPRDWKPHPKSEDYLLFVLEPANEEYRKVEAKFKESLPNFTIISIKRVQNRWLWTRYAQAKVQLAKKNAGAVNEMELFHGSKDTSSENICASEEGFDMRFSQRGLWGQANYFAVKAFYSHHYAYALKEGSCKELILASVLTGDSIECQPTPSLRFPPEKEASRGNLKQVRYDSVNGLAQGYRVYMTYANDRAYPAYIITYSGN